MSGLCSDLLCIVGERVQAAPGKPIQVEGLDAQSGATGELGVVLVLQRRIPFGRHSKTVGVNVNMYLDA
jgi:hypothetical protein